MSLKSKKIIGISLKIATFSLLILIIINFGLNLNKKEKYNTFNFNSAEENILNYKNLNIKPISNVAVAISTNIWIKLYEKNNKISISNIYNTIFSADEVIKNTKTVKENILWKNMLFIKEYYIFIKTDFNKILKNSKNKENTLNSILSQLKLRLNTANKNVHYLLSQKQLLISKYDKIQTNINSIKSNIRYNYKNNNLEQLYLNMDDYYKEKLKLIILNTYILYINDFIKKYYILNEYNKILINVLELNKDAIIKNSYVVVPNKWQELLKKYELLITETEYKKKKQD